MALSNLERQQRYQERKRRGEIIPRPELKTGRDRMREWRANHPGVERARKLELKKTVLTHYGFGNCACVQCGFSDIRALSIDHIDSNGHAHRREKGVYGGASFYRWLITNNLPEMYQTLCMNCQFIKRYERSEL